MAQKKKASSNRRAKSSRIKIKKQHPLKKASRLFLPYPAFGFLMIAVGAFLAYSSFSAGAIDYTVQGKVPAPALTDPAIITSPSNGVKFSAVPISVTGSCPLDSYVNIYRNDLFSGSALCSSDGKFQISTDLFIGTNTLTVRVFNLTDDEGPTSPGITVYYEPPAPVVPPAEESNQPAPAPFVLKTDFRLRGYYVGQKVGWIIDATGGSPPYAISVDWGDGKTSLISRKSDGQFNIEHTYEQAGGEAGSYRIKISASDSAGAKAYIELFVIVNAKDAPAPIFGSTGGSDGSDSYLSQSLLKFLWPAYGVLLLMAASFWLGEREELIELRRKPHRGRRA